MSKMFEKLMEKKGKSPMDEEYKNAKMGTLKALHDEMGKLMGEDMVGMKKVTVAAPDKAGLMKGLDKAEELMGAEEDSEEEPSDEESEEMPMSVEEIEAKMAELQMMKDKMSKKM